MHMYIHILFYVGKKKKKLNKVQTMLVIELNLMYRFVVLFLDH